MLQIELKNALHKVLQSLYNIEIPFEQIKIEETNKDYEGDFTLVVYPYLRVSKKSPEATAHEIGSALLSDCAFIDKFSVIKGFLNITLTDTAWIDELNRCLSITDFGIKQVSDDAPKIVIEYSSPNTNKPLHLGHIRNNLIGHSVSKILKANGYKVIQVNLINDRGIHICKTMLAWLKWGQGKTPDDLGVKGDKFVGDLYVKFEIELQQELQQLTAQNMNEDEALQYSKLMNEARDLLVKWEDEDPEVRKLWKTMNEWVLKGFEATYSRMNISFDKLYFESDTYLIGREIVYKGLEDGVFYRKNDRSVWADLRPEGLDEKILLRSDGTSVYITQDIGTAFIRYQDYAPHKMIYVVGNEQNYHFQVLKLVLKKAGFRWADSIEHLSYGMVELPDGKMKSREGKVVDADDLMDEMFHTARQISEEAGKVSSLPSEEANKIVEIIAQGALKYFILKVDAKKNMVFNPEESVDFNGNTGPFIQYTHARIISLLDKAKQLGIQSTTTCHCKLHPSEKSLIVLLHKFPFVVEECGTTMNPSGLAQYAYELAKEYNGFYQNLPVLKEPDDELRTLRLNISKLTANVLKTAFELLGIDMPGIM